jgi:hypothetical protein
MIRNADRRADLLWLKHDCSVSSDTALQRNNLLFATFLGILALVQFIGFGPR